MVTPFEIRQPMDRLRAAYGVARSLSIYYGRPWSFRRMERFYARFIRRRDLCFDIGAHVGNRVRAWRRLDARVVAVEPQPGMMAVLRTLYGRDRAVTLVAKAVGREPGTLDLHLNPLNPTIATGSQAFLQAARAAPSFAGQQWERTITVPVVTLDELIQAHGRPRFIKIDIEGHEAEALAGLSSVPFAVSVEFVPMLRPVVEACIADLAQRAPYGFNGVFGDEMRFVHPRPLSAAAVLEWLCAMGDDGPAGDVIACLDPRCLER